MANFLSTKDAQLLSVDEFHQSIVGGKYRAEVEAIVKAYQDGTKAIVNERGKETEASLCDVLKKRLPYYVVQADVRARRLLANAKDFTGYAPVDIDHLAPEQVEQVMQRVQSLPWVKEAHRSSRGEGVHLIVAMGVIEVRGEGLEVRDNTSNASTALTPNALTPNQAEQAYKEEYKRRYLAISEAVGREVGVPVDGQCKDVLRGFFVSYDPKAFLRPDEEVEAFDFHDNDTAKAYDNDNSSHRSPSTGSGQADSVSLSSLNPQLIRTYLTYNTYRPSERHSWWIGFAQYLKSKGIPQEAMSLYRNAMQMHLAMHQLIKPDDPLLRSESEVQTAMDWGFIHSEVKVKNFRDSDSHSDSSSTSTSNGQPSLSLSPSLTSQDVWTGNVNDDEELARLKAIRLPEAFEASLSPQPEKVKFPTLCGIMPMAQTYATDVKVRYCDGKFQRLNGMSCIIAKQGGLKSGVKDIISIWKQPLEESDQAAREAEDAFKELRNNRKSNEKLPPQPKDPVIGVTATISCSSLLKRFKRARGKHLFSICEEIDTVRKTNGAGSWSAKYDVYRLSFDNGEWGQDYNSDQAESGVVNVAYNWSFMGTPQAMMKCFAQNGSVENGLTGRVWHSVIPPSPYEYMPKYNDVEQNCVDAILRGVDILKTAKGFIDTPRLRRAAEKWCNGKADEAREHNDEVLDTFRKRAAVIGFRAGVVFHILETGEALMKQGSALPEDFMKDATESSGCVDFALLVADHALKYQCLLYGSQLLSDCQQVNDQAGTYQSRNKNLFEELADEFDFDHLVELRPHTKYNALRTMVYKWKRDGLIEDVKKNLWRKKSAISIVQTS